MSNKFTLSLAFA